MVYAKINMYVFLNKENFIIKPVIFYVDKAKKLDYNVQLFKILSLLYRKWIKL